MMFCRHSILRRFSQFVPRYEPPEKLDIRKFKDFLNAFNNILVLTGAGVSTESGIPDYRSAEVGVFARTSYKPIIYNDFVKNAKARTRYWARNYVGWPRFKSFHPNKIHSYISILSVIPGKVSGLITQNVDGLHAKAGSSNVVELHGNAFWVSCIKCSHTISRFDFQETLEKLNPHMQISASDLRPDGDVELNQEDVENFQVPDCEKCGGILKPTVVFFGENVPTKRVQKVEELVRSSDALLVLGTSLSTLSSFRIVEQAFDLGKFIAIINIGETRGDKFAHLRINTKIGAVLPKEDDFK